MSAELTDRTLIWNTAHLRRLLREYEAFYNQHRPHQALGQAAPLRPLPENATGLETFRIRRRDRAGGILHEYQQVASVIGTIRTLLPVVMTSPYLREMMLDRRRPLMRGEGVGDRVDASASVSCDSGCDRGAGPGGVPGRLSGDAAAR
jgi:hypothetical protein